MATKKIQILDSLIKQAENSDMLDGKHAEEFALSSDMSNLQTLVGDTSVANQISTAITNTTTEIQSYADTGDASALKASQTYTDNAVAQKTQVQIIILEAND